jgi:uncharacterized membrane protein
MNMKKPTTRKKTNYAAVLHPGLAAALVMLAVLAPSAAARAATATDDLRLLRIDLGPNYRGSVPESINDHAQILLSGTPTDGSSYYRLILWSEDAGMVDLGTGGNNAYPKSINNSGQVAWTDSNSDPYRSWLWTPDTLNGTNGTPRQLFAAVDASGVGRILNNSGQVVIIDVTGELSTVVLWTPGGGAEGTGTTRILDGLRRANGLNDSGMVVGRDTNNQAAIWTEATGAVTTIDIAGSSYSSARAVNNNGQVLVSAYVGNSDKLYVWTADGELTDLGNLDSTGSGPYYNNAFDINDVGEIIGAGLYWDGEELRWGEPFALLLPVAVPEPGTWAAFAGGVLLASAALRCWRARS